MTLVKLLGYPGESQPSALDLFKQGSLLLHVQMHSHMVATETSGLFPYLFLFEESDSVLSHIFQLVFGLAWLQTLQTVRWFKKKKSC